MCCEIGDDLIGYGFVWVDGFVCCCCEFDCLFWLGMLFVDVFMFVWCV